MNPKTEHSTSVRTTPTRSAAIKARALIHDACAENEPKTPPRRESVSRVAPMAPKKRAPESERINERESARRQLFGTETTEGRWHAGVRDFMIVFSILFPVYKIYYQDEGRTLSQSFCQHPLALLGLAFYASRSWRYFAVYAILSLWWYTVYSPMAIF